MFDRVRAYDDWLATSAHVPKLLLAFDGSAQTMLIGLEQTAWCAANIANLDIENCGKPEAIAAGIANWADRHQLRRILKG
jgi:haloalkane dehalogenase